jgi:pSer/pThr/pTyr-binding forkhead associated (FHA) protein
LVFHHAPFKIFSLSETGSATEKSTMATLLVRTAGLDASLIDLRLGVTRLGRSPDADFTLTHPTISNMHCELLLSENAVVVRDLESTNGTFINDKKIREATLSAGDVLRLGDVELLVDNTAANVAIPKFSNEDIPAPPKVRKDGAIVCPRHAHARATYQCTVCKEIMCDQCVHQLRRRGGKKVLMLCPICSGSVEPLGGVTPQKKKSFFTRVGETVKIFKRTVNIDKRD